MGHALLDERRNLRRSAHARRAADADRAQGAALQIRLHRRQRRGAEVDLPADEVGDHRAHALVRNVVGLAAGLVDEHLRGEVQDGAVARRGVVQLPRLGLQQRHQLLRVVRRHPRVDEDDDWRGADDGDRRDVVDRIERHRFVDARVDHVVVRHHAERVAVGRGLHQRRRADDATGARLVLHHHRVAQGLAEGALRGAHDGVHARRSGHRQDEAHRPVALRAHGTRQQQAGAGERAQLQQHGAAIETVTKGLAHRVSPVS